MLNSGWLIVSMKVLAVALRITAPRPCRDLLPFPKFGACVALCVYRVFEYHCDLVQRAHRGGAV